MMNSLEINNNDYTFHVALRTIIMNPIMCTDDAIPTAFDVFIFCSFKKNITNFT